MAINQIACFDLFPTLPLVDDLPVQGAGLTGTPQSFGPTSTGSQNCTIGVSDQESDGFGEPGAKRRALIAAKTTVANQGASINFGSTLTLNPSTAGYAGTTYRHVFGFSFKDMGAVVTPNVIQVIVQGTRATNGGTSNPVYTLFGINTNGHFMINSSTSGVQRELNREYYIEIELRSTIPTSGNTTFQVQALLWVDGENVATVNLFSTTTGSSNTWLSAVRWGIFPAAGDTQRRRYAMADHYRVTPSLTSTPPYDNRLGPQRVILARPRAVVENNGWTPKNAVSVEEALLEKWADPDVAAVSPPDEGTLTLEMDWGINPATVVNGVRFFSRLQREGTLGRDVVMTWVNAENATIEEATVSPTTTPAYFGQSLRYGRVTVDSELFDYASLISTKVKLRALVG